MSNQTRRTFLMNSSMTIAAGSALLCAPRMRTLAQSTGYFKLELDGAAAGWIARADGAQMIAATPSSTTSVNGMIVKAPPNKVSWTPLSLTCGGGMSAAFYQWLQQSLMHASPTKSGAVLMCGYNAKEGRRLDWTSSRIIQVQFPPLVAGSKGIYEVLVVIGADSFNYRTYACMPVDKTQYAHWPTETFSLGAAGYPELGLVTSISAINISLNASTRGGSFTFQIPPQQMQQRLPNAPIGIQPQQIPPNLAAANRSLIPPLQLVVGPSPSQSPFTLTFLQPLLTRLRAPRMLPSQPTQFQVDFADMAIAFNPALLTYL